jgi:phosphatidylglycerophosphatase A
MQKSYVAFATGMYSGYLPKMPGTWGSMVGLLIFYALDVWGGVKAYHGLILVFFISMGYLSTVHMIDITQKVDPKEVVIDEIAGLYLLLWLIPEKNYAWMLIGFGLFRLFDILKPFPISFIEKWFHTPHNPSFAAIGVMVDDLLAGIFALGVVYALYALWKGFV